VSAFFVSGVWVACWVASFENVLLHSPDFELDKTLYLLLLNAQAFLHTWMN
jgi:hypothetical protein